MASKSKGKGFAGIPWPVSLVAAHVIADVVTKASCPGCDGHVVLYVCVNCKKFVRPRRGRATT